MSAARRAAPAIAIVVALAMALVGQAMTDRLTPQADSAATGRAVGRASLSYASGIRTFTAAVLWNRLEPILHSYYAEVDLANQRYLLSTIAVVEELDPHLTQPFYIGSWVLAQNGKTDAAFEMAERGVAENPKAGILWVNLAQLRQFYANDLPGAAEAAEHALEDDIEWTDDVERHNAFPILGAIFRKAGRADLDAIVQEELKEIDAELGSSVPSLVHDHDGDGTPDH